MSIRTISMLCSVAVLGLLAGCQGRSCQRCGHAGYHHAGNYDQGYSPIVEARPPGLPAVEPNQFGSQGVEQRLPAPGITNPNPKLVVPAAKPQNGLPPLPTQTGQEEKPGFAPVETSRNEITGPNLLKRMTRRIRNIASFRLPQLQTRQVCPEHQPGGSFTRITPQSDSQFLTRTPTPLSQTVNNSVGEIREGHFAPARFAQTGRRDSLPNQPYSVGDVTVRRIHTQASSTNRTSGFSGFDSVNQPLFEGEIEAWPYRKELETPVVPQHSARTASLSNTRSDRTETNRVDYSRLVNSTRFSGNTTAHQVREPKPNRTYFQPARVAVQPNERVRIEPRVTQNTQPLAAPSPVRNSFTLPKFMPQTVPSIDRSPRQQPRFFESEPVESQGNSFGQTEVQRPLLIETGMYSTYRSYPSAYQPTNRPPASAGSIADRPIRSRNFQ